MLIAWLEVAGVIKKRLNESQDISLVQCYEISALMQNGVVNLIAHLYDEVGS